MLLLRGMSCTPLGCRRASGMSLIVPPSATIASMSMSGNTTWQNSKKLMKPVLFSSNTVKRERICEGVSRGSRHIWSKKRLNSRRLITPVVSRSASSKIACTSVIDRLRSMRCSWILTTTLVFSLSSHTLLKFVPTIVSGIDMKIRPLMIASDVIALPECDAGDKSPYPTVEKVTSMNQIPLPMSGKLPSS